MSHQNILELLIEYYQRYNLPNNFRIFGPLSLSFIDFRGSDHINGFENYLGSILSWISAEHPEDYDEFRSRLLAEIDSQDIQHEILDAAYSCKLILTVPDLRLLTPHSLKHFVDSDHMGTGDVLIDLLLRRKYDNEKMQAEIGPQALHPEILVDIVERIPKMYSLILELSTLPPYFPLISKRPGIWPNKPHPVKPQLPISNYSSITTSEYQEYIGSMLDLLKHPDIMAAVCKKLVTEEPPGIWTQLVTDFYGADPSNPMVKSYTKQAAAEHIYMRQAAIMQPVADDALAYNAETVQRKIRSSLNLARFLYLNHSQATDHLDIVAAELTSAATKDLIYYIGDQKIQDMDLEQVKQLIIEKLKLPREQDADFARFLKSIIVRPPTLRLSS